MTEHRIDLPPVLPSTTRRVSCTCGSWADVYISAADHQRVSAAAQQHIVQRCTVVETEWDDHDGGTVLTGQQA